MIIEIILSALSVIASVVAAVAILAYWLGRRFERIDARFERIEERFEGRFAGIERALRSLALASAEAQRVIVDFLSLKGLLERSESEYLARRIEGLFRVYAGSSSNPLSEDELRFIREFFSRVSKDADSATMEEAERAYEIGKRIFAEGDERGFLVAVAAAYARGYLVSREVRKRKLEGARI